MFILIWKIWNLLIRCFEIISEKKFAGKRVTQFYNQQSIFLKKFFVDFLSFLKIFLAQMVNFSFTKKNCAIFEFCENFGKQLFFFMILFSFIFDRHMSEVRGKYVCITFLLVDLGFRIRLWSFWDYWRLTWFSILCSKCFLRKSWTRYFHDF